MEKSAMLEVIDFKYKQNITYIVKHCLKIPKNFYTKQISEVPTETYYECLHWSNKVLTNNNNINNYIFFRWNTTAIHKKLPYTFTNI